MPTFGDRLREVREAMGLSQQELADRCGVTMRSQRNYEKGERNPDSAYLAAIAAAGADVLYLLTGQRQGGLSPMSMSQSQTNMDVVAPASSMRTLTPRQAALLDNYDGSDEDGKRYIERAADLEAQSASGGRKQAARSGQR